MKITSAMTDAAIAQELFERLEKQRKVMQITQEEMAERVGITRKSYAAVKHGISKLSTFIAILRQLELLDNLELIATPAGRSPMEALRDGGKKSKNNYRSSLDINIRPAVRIRVPTIQSSSGRATETNPILARRQRLKTTE